MTQQKFNGTDTYRVAPELGAMVNLAMARDRPILLTGEAGTGKTQLAYAIGKALGASVHRAQMTSTMEGEEVCYTFDSVLRLTDAQVAGNGGEIDGRNVSDPMCYVRFGALGRGYVADERCVVLLDEIDKTDSDVQDDLLRALESHEFEIREANEVVCANYNPVVVITSNAKRELSDAFLRRVYAHHIDFPDQEAIGEIVMMHYPDLSREMREHAANVVYELRESGFEKPPATSELLEWIGCLTLMREMPPRSIHTGEPIPFAGVLLKRRTDLERVSGGRSMGRRSREQRVRR
jgi:MoxR-like ATPase